MSSPTKEPAKATEPTIDLLSDTSLEARIKLESLIPLEGVKSKDAKDTTSVRSVTNLSPEAVEEHYGDLLVQLSPKRKAMSLRNALMIAAGRTEHQKALTAERQKALTTA